TPKRTRYCPAAVARAVFLRDGKRCSYVSKDGRRCSARRCLELDHVDPFAVGGECTLENLRLRCRAHNQRYARLYFGDARVSVARNESRSPHLRTELLPVPVAEVRPRVRKRKFPRGSQTEMMLRIRSMFSTRDRWSGVLSGPATHLTGRGSQTEARAGFRKRK